MRTNHVLFCSIVLMGLAAMGCSATSAGHGFFGIGGSTQTHGGETQASLWQQTLHNAGFWIILGTFALCAFAARSGKIANAPSIAIAGGASLAVVVITSLAIPYIQTALLVLAVAGAGWTIYKIMHGEFNLASIKVAMTQDLASAKALGAALQAGGKSA